MKALAIFVLWAFAGWDVGAWAEAVVGIPAVVGVVAGLALGAWLAIETRRRMVASAGVPARETASLEIPPALDRAA